MTEILFDKALNDKILRGVDILADVVGSTLGPKGRTVLIKNKDRKAFLTKDGVTCAKAVKLSDPFENLGVEIARQAAEATLASAGDGTTTATVLTRAILKKAQSYITAGDSPKELKKGIDLAVKALLSCVQEHVIPITSLDQIEQIATISANGDKGIGKMISIAVDKIGRDGAITIQESRSTETSLDVSEGFSFDAGFLAPIFITDERRGVVRYEDCWVLVTDKVLVSIDEMLPLLNQVARDGKPFVIIAEQIEPQLLALLIMNNAKGSMKIMPIKAPRYGEERRNILEDLSIVLGGKFISRESGLRFESLQLTDLGLAKIAETSKTSTTIVSYEKNQTRVQDRVSFLKEMLQKTENEQEMIRLQQRLTRLSSGIAVIKVGGATEVEMIEKKHRIEDALEAIKAGQLEGVVVGGGCALLRAAQKINPEVENIEQSHGVEVVKHAALAPFRKIMKNAGLSPEVCLEHILNNPDESYGYDAGKGHIVNLLDTGIIDPFRVIKSALENAASCASSLLTTSVGIIE